MDVPPPFGNEPPFPEAAPTFVPAALVAEFPALSSVCPADDVEPALPGVPPLESADSVLLPHAARSRTAQANAHFCMSLRRAMERAGFSTNAVIAAFFAA